MKFIGKHVSCGAIVLYCLNLSPHLRYRPENTFIIGLTPPPHMPTATTICHLLDPFLSSISKYGIFPGQNVATFQYPAGVFVQVKITPLIADLEASRKVAGFLTHAATMFCSFCLCTHDQLEDLDYHSWQLRDSAQVRLQAKSWLDASTKSAQKALEITSGVRWSPFHQLPYWDPVKHVVLGFMHNWLEGILQHHLRTLWGIGRDKDEAQKAQFFDEDEQWTEEDISDSAEELDDIIRDVSDQNMEPLSATRRDTFSEPPNSPSISSTTSQASSSSGTPTASQFPYRFDDDDDDPDYIPINDSPFNFTNLQLQIIRDAIQHILLPTWVQRPPVNLGEPSHGKLKAREYLTLFTTIFPLILPEFWYIPTATDLDREHFLCFFHLVSATNIVSSFQTSNASADAYSNHYFNYRAAIQRLFPNQASKPNHHYAMHNGSLLKYWGPLASFSEFPGERMNGMLQNTKTNHQLRMFYLFCMVCWLIKYLIGNMDLTMLRQMSRRARVDALLHDHKDTQELANILEPVLSSTEIPVSLKPTDTAEFLKKATPLLDVDYNSLLQYLNATGRPYRHFNNFPHPPQSLILPFRAQRPYQIHQGESTFSCQTSHKGNSSIQFYNPHTQTHDTGAIETIWQLPLEALLQTFIVVRQHQPLPTHEEQKAPFIHYPGFQSRAVDAALSNKLVIIEPTHIITHLTVLPRPIDTYGIDRNFLVICWALNRGRR